METLIKGETISYISSLSLLFGEVELMETKPPGRTSTSPREVASLRRSGINGNHTQLEEGRVSFSSLLFGEVELMETYGLTQTQP